MNKNLLVVLIIVMVIIIGAIYFLQQPKNMEDNQPNMNNDQSDQPSGSEANNSPKTFDVTIVNFSFSPTEITIKAGDTVTWTNQESAPHTISGNGFQSNTLSKGQSFSFTFDNKGVFDYICGIHPSMKGRITVQ